MSGVTVLGSLNVDLLTEVPHLPRRGETVSGRSAGRLPGGKGANQAVACARAGARVRMVGACGTDEVGDLLVSALEDEGIDVRDVHRAAGSTTGTATIFVDSAGENMIVLSPGANDHVGAEQVDAACSDLAPGDVLLMQLEIPVATVHLAAERARRRGATVVLNAAPIFAMMFMINGASLLSEERLVPSDDQTLTHQAGFLTAVHPTFQYLYFVAVFFAFFGSLYAFWEMYSYTAYESLGAVSRKVRLAGQRAVRPYMYTYMMIASLTLVWTIGELVVIVTPASVLGGLLMSGVFCLALGWTERRVLPPQYRLTTAGRWWVIVSGVLLTVLGLISTWQLIA
ncbi:MAG: hypothetical protein GEU96_20735 [Propionibacteriales bacterium]|nr:hypothetical protein [Propionibacteriales bacterium]